MYLLAITVLSFLAFLDVFNKEFIERYKLLFAFVCFSFLVFQDGFRWETGTDWDPYYSYFEGLTIEYGIYDSSFDLGYVLFNYIIRIFTDDYSMFLIIFALLFYSVFFIFIFRLSNYPFVTLLIFYMLTVCYMGMNRQFMAMMFYVLSILALVNNRKVIFLLAIIVGAFFHKTALIGIFLLLLQRRIPNKVLFCCLIFALVIAITGIINKIPLSVFVLLGDESLTKMEVYTYEEHNLSLFSSVFSLIRKVIWIIPLIVLEKKISEKPAYYYLFFNVYFLGTIFYILFNGTIFQIIVSRALIYYNIMEMFLVPYVLSLLKPNYGKLIIMFFVVIYVCININKGFNSYGEGTDYFVPYKGIFINTNYSRQFTR